MRIFIYSLLNMIFTGSLILFNSAVAATDPKVLSDESWISLNGTVVSSTDNAFRLDYGTDIITVEMDDWDWFNESAAIIEGDRVTVNGRIDKDLFEKRSIEASSVYVKGFNTYYYASSADEEPSPYLIGNAFVLPAETGNTVNLIGTVASIDGRELTLKNEGTAIRIDTIGMSYNPLDNQGFQQIKKGDRISVSGNLDVDFFEKNEIMADSIISLSNDNS